MRSAPVHAAPKRLAAACCAAFVGVALLVCPSLAAAHFTETFEAGDAGTYTNRCWQLGGATISSTDALLGAYSVRTGVLGAGVTRTVSGPWVNMDGFGQIQWRHRITSTAGAPKLTVTRVSRTGARTVIWSGSYLNTDNLAEQVPAVYRGVFRFEFAFTGASAAARGQLDHVTFPSEPFSKLDTNNGSGACEAYDCLVEEDCADFADRPVCAAADKACVACVIDNHCGTDTACVDHECNANVCEATYFCEPDAAVADASDPDGSPEPPDAAPGDASSPPEDGAPMDGPRPHDAAADSAPHDANPADAAPPRDAAVDGTLDGATKPWLRAAGGGCAVPGGRTPHGRSAWLGVIAWVGLARRARRARGVRRRRTALGATPRG